MKPTSIIVLGPPNTGKSSFLGSITEIVPADRVALIALRSKEKDSWRYRESGLTDTALTLIDPEWRPELNMFVATDYHALLKQLLYLYKSDEYDAVLIDPLTDAFELAGHALLAGDKVSTPKDLPGKGGSMSYYGALKKKSKQIVTDLTSLTVAPHPKWVLAAMHTQPVAEENMLAPNKITADKRAREVRFEGDVLPQMEGGYKFDMIGDFAVKLYTNIKTSPANPPEFRVQIRADTKRHAGIGLAAAGQTKYVPNDLKSLIAEIENPGTSAG